MIYDKNDDLKYFKKQKDFSKEELLIYVEYIEKDSQLGMVNIITHLDIDMFRKDSFPDVKEETAHKIYYIAEKYSIPIEIN